MERVGIDLLHVVRAEEFPKDARFASISSGVAVSWKNFDARAKSASSYFGAPISSMDSWRSTSVSLMWRKALQR